MVKKIYIFSGTKNLFNTVIKHEINDLIRKHDVYVFKEYENISISKNKSVKYINLHGKNQNKSNSILQKIRNAFIIRSKILESYKKNSPNILIVHSNIRLRDWQAIFFAKKNYRSWIIRRTPSAVVDPQRDYIWLRTRTNWVKLTISRILNNIILSVLTTGKINDINLRWFPSCKSLYKKIKPNYDHSLCYSKRCKKWLKTIGEDSMVIRWPSSENICLPKTENKNALIVTSSDHETVSGYLGLDPEESIWLVNKTIFKIACDLHAQHYSVQIKFRNSEDQGYFKKQYTYDKIKSFKQVSPNCDVYSIVNSCSIIVGFVTSILWKLSLLQSNLRLISYQLIPNSYFSEFKDTKRILYVPNGRNVADHLYRTNTGKNTINSKLKTLSEFADQLT
jgi:hypothetical protein